MDIELTETHDGGDFVLVEVSDETGKFHDLGLDGGLSTAIYLSHFGGNIKASTTGNERPGELRRDFWGNALIENDSDMQANSLLERSLIELPITSGNLLKFEDAAQEDLKWLLDNAIAASVSSEAFITSPEAVKVIDSVNELANDTGYEAFWSFDKNRALNGGN